MQLERVERRKGERAQATKLIKGRGWIEGAVTSSRLLIQTGTGRCNLNLSESCLKKLFKTKIRHFLAQVLKRQLKALLPGK